MNTSDCADKLGFSGRHIGLSRADRLKMLAELGYPSVESLVDAAVPADIRTDRSLRLPQPLSEADTRQAICWLADTNVTAVSMIGLGYYPTVTPAVVRRNVLENPAWYTAYTPYQPEISQGRLEALLNFQTMVSDLSALAFANASLLDESTAVAEAVALMRRASTLPAQVVLVDADTLPQTLDVVCTRARAIGLEVVLFDPDCPLPAVDTFGAVLSYPGTSGVVRPLADHIASFHERGILVTVAADLLALTLVMPPGELGADVAVGSAQRFGVPMFYGGPHAGYMAVRAGLERQLPGRLVGVSVDSSGHPAYRLALQAREQHIRRDRATSNICTAQALLAMVAGMYAVYHGPEGLRDIALRVHSHARQVAQGLRGLGIAVAHEAFFDTVLASVPGHADEVLEAAGRRGVLLRRHDHSHVGISCSELTTAEHVRAVLDAFGEAATPRGSSSPRRGFDIPAALRRTSPYLGHPVFSEHRSETAMLRYLRRLSDRDLALDRCMIPLGSCTMKLNAATEMEAVSLSGFSDVHPFAPAEHAVGYQRLISDLEDWLAEVTGYYAVSLQPNAGSQGELAGLLAIRAYLHDQGEGQRDVCLVPSSAHGTNAASAALAGLRVVVVASGPDGTIDRRDLRSKCTGHAGRLAAIMVTYPSTHGVYEASIREVCALVHSYGGQVYLDGANLNALLGIARPGELGGDVSHLNLHKTFCIPHGGGGPGVGPIAVARHLAPYLPSHPLHPDLARRTGVGAVSAAPFGSAGVLPVAWAYIRMMGAAGLLAATQAAVLSANYVAARLAPYFPVLYSGANGLVAHECILDLRAITAATGITVDDVAKRLIDYGFHAPTMSFPVPGTLMVEPTESEPLAELDRFCNALIAIKGEIDLVVGGQWSAEDSPLRQAPHTAADVVGSWGRAYSREEGALPAGTSPVDKYWPPVGRIDQAYGDRNLNCTCPPPEALEG